MPFKNNSVTVSAFAPASCANVAVGFDILGFALDCVGDTVSLTRHQDKHLIIEAIEAEENLPYDIDKNIATWVIKEYCEAKQLPMNFTVRIKKGIALGSGMGGSAASAVAALMALNEFLSEPMDLITLASYAIAGEELVSGSKHGDNVVPCLYGGMTLNRSIEPLDVIQLPLIDLFCILIHPNLRVDTRDARAILPKEMPLKTYVKQSANLATFIAGLYEARYDLIQQSLDDVLIEPWRAKLVKGFYEVKAAAIAANALGASLSGSGPSMFAFAKTLPDANRIKENMIAAFASVDIASTGWVSKINPVGARIL